MARQYPMKKDSYTISSGWGPRAGGFHYGLDFAAPDGTSFYACAGGKVLFIGAAQGYGQWIVIDHPASEGGGCTEYGHMWNAFATGLKAGDWVSAGQLIGYVGSNGGSTGPHLHLTVWERAYGGRRIDPAPWLAGCPHPGETPGTGGQNGNASKEGAAVTIFGVDVSEHQNGMNLGLAAAEAGLDFAIVRTTDGTHRDRVYRSHMQDAESAGLITAAYHYLRNPSEGRPISAQVQASIEVMGDYRRPIWIDVETPAGIHVDHIRECKRLFEQAGVRVIGCYSYVPYWERKIAPREPDSHEFGHFWVAAYGRNQPGAAQAIYPGNEHRQWTYPLGGQVPSLWQYSSEARFGSWRGGTSGVDINAFRGTKEELRTLFYGTPADPVASEEAPRMEKMTRWLLDQFVGPEWSDGKPRFSGWAQTEGRTFVDYVVSKLKLIPDMAKAVGELPGKLDRTEQLLIEMAKAVAEIPARLDTIEAELKKTGGAAAGEVAAAPVEVAEAEVGPVAEDAVAVEAVEAGPAPAER
ncbi:Murein hydrolase activator EnvC precursor [Corynebacterium canis]|uniref:peptidoglycan DD-metalloendopeptidase family protein n=2 Tax=Corynebacterium canis TaxID=679663 RepID=UPI001FED0D78|nr:peptidoglycan DD-metalloendopeptidase family protein [Corynebacterium canis]WJY74756.1 Murein hydrolase activator EnvC precursor [Corynebacterium canis]